MRNDPVLVPDARDALVGDGGLGPLVEVGRLGGQLRREAGGDQAVLDVGVEAEEEGAGLDLYDGSREGV